jgi:hypothetical protein
MGKNVQRQLQRQEQKQIPFGDDKQEVQEQLRNTGISPLRAGR